MTPRSQRIAKLRHTTALCLGTTLALTFAMPGILTAQDQVTAGKKAAQTEEGAPVTLAPVTIYADRQGASVSDIAASVTVIDGAQIEARGQSDLYEITRYLPGVTVQRQTTSTDPFNTLGGITIRGVGGNRVQMMVDGSRMAERITDGTRDYLDLNFTKQVDVVKGPASVLWGADALGGVLAVQTIDPEDLLQGRTRGGSARLSFDGLNDETGISTAFAQRFGSDFSAMIGVSRTDASQVKLSNARNDGGIYGCPRNVEYGATPCGELNPADIEANRILAKAVWTPSDTQRLEFSFDHLQRDTKVQYNNGIGPVKSSSGVPTGEVVNSYNRRLELERSRYALEHTWSPGPGGFVDELRTTLAFTPHSYDRQGAKWTRSAAADSILTDDYLSYAEDFFELDIQATSRFITGSAEHEVTWGFDGDTTKTDYSRRDVVNNFTQGTVTERRAGGFNFANSDTRRADIYIQDKISMLDGALEITPGLRYATFKIDPRPNADYLPIDGVFPATRSDNKLLSSLGALYRFGNGWQVWGHYGEGFKMPTAQQLYTSVPGTFYDLLPAPNLSPEEVESIEIGVRRELDRGGFGVTAFRADYTNFIQSFWNPPGTPDYTYRNLSSVNVWGIEFEGHYALTDTLRVSGSAAWQKGRQQAEAGATKTPHTLAPFTTSLGLTWDLPEHGLTFDVIGTFAQSVKHTASDRDFKPAGYGLIDTFAKWEVADNTALNIGIKNLFDKRYFEANAATYSVTPGSGVPAGNPIELQTGPGRVFTASLDMKF